MHLLANVDRIAAEVGWSPGVRFEKGLRDLAEWYGIGTVDSVDHDKPAGTTA
jgi:dTDP-D-glucose 4,6-dehydratase